MRKVRNLWGLGITLAVTVLIFSFLPLRTAFELGDDEGYEVIKGFMCFKGFKLYTQIWNDQPPVETMLLSAAFKMFGPTIGTARLVAAGFGLLLVGTFYELIRQRSGHTTALLAVFFLLSAPGVLLLSVSVMLEVPAFATALLAVIFLDRWKEKKNLVWLLASGVTMGIALQIKLTSVIVAPGLLFELLLAHWPTKAPGIQTGIVEVQKRTAKQKANPQTQETSLSANTSESVYNNTWRLRLITIQSMTWFAGVVGIFLLIGMTWGKGAFESSWKSHTKTADVLGMERAEDHKFEPLLLRSHVECVIGSILCVVLALWKRRLREIAFPILLVLTASAIHSVHRPWWNYYYLHLALPLCWLTGWAVGTMIGSLFDLQLNRRFKLSSAATWKGIGLCILVASGIACSERRMESSIKGIRERQTIDANPVVQKMRAVAAQMRWAYSESGIYPFHVQLPVPPELAIIVLKRFWSGQLSREEIVKTCRRYQPGMIVLPRARPNEEWMGLLQADYELITIDAKSMLYFAKVRQPSGQVSNR